MKSFFLIFIAGVILAVGNGFRMSLGIYVPDLITSTVFSASLIGLTYEFLIFCGVRCHLLLEHLPNKKDM